MPVENNTRIPPKVPGATQSSTTTPVNGGVVAPPAPTHETQKPPPELPPAAPEVVADDYAFDHQPERTVTTRIVVAGQPLPLAQSVDQLVPEMSRFIDPGELAARYGADFVVMAEQLIGQPGLTKFQRAERMYAFFLAYAHRFVEIVQQPPPGAHGGHHGGEGTGADKKFDLQTALKTFVEALKDTGFGELKEATTGQNGVEVARSLLLSKNVPELERRADQKVLVPARTESPSPSQEPRNTNAETAQPARPPGPEQFVHHAERASPEHFFPAAELAAGQSARSDRREDAMVGDRMRVNTWGPENARVVVQPKGQSDSSNFGGDDQSPLDRMRGTAKRLGGNLFWNVLHRSRNDPNDSAVEQEKWDRLTFGAVLALVGVGLLVIVLVNL